LSSHLGLGLSKGPFPVGLPVKILKELLPSSILATCPAHLNHLDLIILTILGERYKLEVPLVDGLELKLQEQQFIFSFWTVIHI
jgi:hypothetical protein